MFVVIRFYIDWKNSAVLYQHLCWPVKLKKEINKKNIIFYIYLINGLVNLIKIYLKVN